MEDKEDAEMEEKVVGEHDHPTVHFLETFDSPSFA